MKLTKNFERQEFEFSQTAQMLGIDNTIPQEFIPAIRETALQLQILRAYCRKPVVITSGYRCKALNEAIKGSKNSHHTKGYAADFIIPGMSIEDIIEIGKEVWLFDQLINEFDQWVHVSFYPSMRGEVFKL